MCVCVCGIFLFNVRYFVDLVWIKFVGLLGYMDLRAVGSLQSKPVCEAGATRCIASFSFLSGFQFKCVAF